MSVNIIRKEEIEEDLSKKIPKLHFRKIAIKSGWSVPNYCLLKVKFNKMEPKDITSLDISLLKTNLLHLLLVRPSTIQNKVFRTFISKQDHILQLKEYIKKIRQNLADRKNLLFLLTEVIEPQISGISLYYNKNCLIEYGVGQMVAKGTSNLCKALLNSKKILKKKEVIQKKLVKIKSNGKQIINYNSIPRIEDFILRKINLLSHRFHQNSRNFHSIEWISDFQKKIWFIDSTIERLDNIQNFINYNFFKDKCSKTISPGKCIGKIKKVINFGRPVKSLDKHVSERLDSNNKTRDKWIYASEKPFLSLSKYIPHALGFIFKEGSLLCHLSNQIRSVGLPAIIDEDIFHSVQDGMRFKLNCEKEHNFKHKNKKQFLSPTRYKKIIEKTPITLDVYPKKEMNFENKSLVKSIGSTPANLHVFNSPESRIPRTPIFSNSFFLDYDKKEFYKLVRLKFPEFEKDPNFSLICRSSANLEDGFNFSLAGIFRSYGNLKKGDEVFDAIAQVLKFKNIKQLKMNYQLNPDKIKMSIIIQEWINPIVGGILFSRLPNNLESSKLLLEYEFGRSDGVTSGIFNPFSLKISRNKINDFRSINNMFKNSNLAKKTTIHKFMGFLNKCIQIEDFLHYPVDIEFLINQNGEFYFTQLRPIIDG